MYVVGNGGDGAAGDSSTGGGGDRRKQGCVPRVWEGSLIFRAQPKDSKKKRNESDRRKVKEENVSYRRKTEMRRKR